MRSGGRRRTGVITSLFAFVPLVDVVAFRGPFIFSRPSLQAVSLQAGLVSNESGDWINHGLLLSSFTDGLKPNPEAIDFLMRGLVASLGREFQAAAETKVTESALQSPCCGPDLDAIMRMESVDVTLAKLEQGQMSWREVLKAFVESSIDDKPLALRLLYIPTAMYALRQDSNNTPGKQRQRARADGKKRRNEIVELLSSQLGQHVVIQAVSLDLDDGSVKQPEGSDNPSVFPKVRIDCRYWSPSIGSIIDSYVLMCFFLEWQRGVAELEAKYDLRTGRKHILVVSLYRERKLGR